MNREQLAWAAGIIDGEGNLRNYKTKKVLSDGTPRTYYSPSIHVTQTAKCGGVPDMLTRLQDLFPGSRINGPYQRKEINQAEYYDWTLHSFERTQAAICMIWLWLGSQKKTDALNMMGEYLTDRAERGSATLKARTRPRDWQGRFLPNDNTRSRT